MEFRHFSSRFFGIFLGLTLVFFASSQVFAADFYMSTSGSDASAGTQAQPFRTFAKGVSVLQPGDTLNVGGGTYQENLVVNRSGTASQRITVKPVAGQTVIIDGQGNREDLIDVPNSYVNVSGFEVKNSKAFCVNLIGQNITASGLTVHDCEDHGIYSDGKQIVIDGNTVYLSNLENQSRNASSGWGSAIKLRVGADDVIIQNNTVYHNYGEGIAATRATNVTIRDNRVYDNFAVNIYVDNSHDVVVERNFITCEDDTTARGFYRDGHSAHAIALAEEQYDGWGAQLRNVTVKNNITGFCHKSFSDFGADVSGGGLDNVLVAYNTFWGSTDTAIALESESAKTRNTRFLNNIIQQPNGENVSMTRSAGITFNNNFWVNTPPADPNASGSNDKTGNVQMLTTPGYSPTTYRLGAGSPAIDSAQTISGIADDYEKKKRPIGALSDMGAIEFGEVLTGVPTATFTPSPTITPSTSPTIGVSGQPTATSTPISEAGYCAGINIYKVTGDVTNPSNWVVLTPQQLTTLQPNEIIYVSTIGAPSTVIFSQARIKVNLGTPNPVVYNQSEAATLLKPGSLFPEFYRTYTMPSVIYANQEFFIASQVYSQAYDNNANAWDDNQGWR